MTPHPKSSLLMQKTLLFLEKGEQAVFRCALLPGKRLYQLYRSENRACLERVSSLLIFESSLLYPTTLFQSSPHLTQFQHYQDHITQLHYSKAHFTQLNFNIKKLTLPNSYIPKLTSPNSNVQKLTLPN